MVKVSDSSGEGGVEVIHQEPEGKLTGRIFGALFNHDRQHHTSAPAPAPAPAPKRPEALKAPAWGELYAGQEGLDNTINPFGIGFTEEDFHQLEQKWGIHDLQNDPAGSDTSPTGSGKIGGNVYTPDSDESRVSDKRAVAVGFGCTYVAGGSSVVMINDIGEAPSVDGGVGQALIGIGGGGGGGGIGDGRDLGARRESVVHHGGGGRPFSSPLSKYAQPEETSDERTYSPPIVGMPEGTPEVLSTAIARRQQPQQQKADASALFGAVDSAFSELFPASARLHDVDFRSAGSGGDAGVAPTAECLTGAGLSRDAEPVTSGGGAAPCWIPTTQEESTSAKCMAPVSLSPDAGPAASGGGAAPCLTPTTEEEGTSTKYMVLVSPSRHAEPASSGGGAATCGTTTTQEEGTSVMCIAPGSPSRDGGPATSGGGESRPGTPTTEEEGTSAKCMVLVSPSRGTGSATSARGASAFWTSATQEEGASVQCMASVSPFHDAGPAASGGGASRPGTPTTEEEGTSGKCMVLASPSHGTGQATSVLGASACEAFTTRERVHSAVSMVPASPARDAAPATSDNRTPSRGSKAVFEKLTLETCARWPFEDPFGLNVEDGGQANGDPAFVAEARKAPPPGSLIAVGATAGPDYGTGGDDGVARASPARKPDPVAGGRTFRSATKFLQRTAGAIAASFFGTSPEQTTTDSHDSNTAKGEGAGWRDFPGSVPRERRAWYHASVLAPVSTHPV